MLSRPDPAGFLAPVPLPVQLQKIADQLRLAGIVKLELPPEMQPFPGQTLPHALFDAMRILLDAPLQVLRQLAKVELDLAEQRVKLPLRVYFSRRVFSKSVKKSVSQSVSARSKSFGGAARLLATSASSEAVRLMHSSNDSLQLCSNCANEARNSSLFALSFAW